MNATRKIEELNEQVSLWKRRFYAADEDNKILFIILEMLLKQPSYSEEWLKCVVEYIDSHCNTPEVRLVKGQVGFVVTSDPRAVTRNQYFVYPNGRTS